MKIENIPETEKKRVVIIGGGFAGTRLVENLLHSPYQIVLIDQNNYYQFQPLMYQVALGGLEPSSVCFPLRRRFHGKKYDFHFRMGKLTGIDTAKSEIETSIGNLKYDYLVLAAGVGTNFFGNKNMETHALTLKSVSDSILIRNTILEHFEKAINSVKDHDRQEFLNIAIVGGGPSGVELAGAFAEMRKNILPKDYPDISFSNMKIYLFEAGPKVLGNMSQKSIDTALAYLKKLSVDVRLNTPVKDFDGQVLTLEDGTKLPTRTVIWSAGVIGTKTKGLEDAFYGKANRIITDEFSKVKGTDNIFAIGDISLVQSAENPKGHPQLAPVALQQADQLAKNLIRISQNKEMTPFKYLNKGAMATIGRNLAVADFKTFSLKGFPAWIIWSMVHLFSILGVKNKVFIFFDWAVNYFHYDPSLRLLIKHKKSNAS